MIEAHKKQVLLKSWQNTTYQKAIWRARKRLLGKQDGEISDLELKILEENLLSESKPDYTRWVDTDITSKRSQPTLTNSKQRFDDLKNFPIIQEYETPNVQRPRSAVVQYLSVVDQAPIHNSSSPQQSTVDLSTSYDDFGLCAGCFHKKGPHYHYHAPVRIGGGYSIYRRPNAVVPPNYNSDINWNTIQWLADLGKDEDIHPSKRQYGFGDDYSAKLFDQYVSRGGDPTALKEYLDSNCNPEALNDLRASGVNVDLLLEYTELYRKHLKLLLQENIKKQSKVVEKETKTLDHAIMYAGMENDGADMKTLVALLRKGRSCLEYVQFENKGGNTEILEHFAQMIYEDPSRDVIISEFEKFLRKSEQRHSAQIFINYLSSGGDLGTLKACLNEGSADLLPSLSQSSIFLLEDCMNKFKTNEEFLKELKLFLQNHLHLHQGAELLQEFIENGGNIRTLKEFVEDDCNVLIDDQDSQNENNNFDLLNKVGRSFLKSPTLRKTLEEFPEEPQLLEVYIRQGGSFPLLVKAISLVTESPRFEEYVLHETRDVSKKLTKEQEQTGVEMSVSVERTSNDGFLNTDSLSADLLTHILGKAKANLVFNELIKSETNMKQNEGVFLSKSINLQSFINAPSVPSVDLVERQQVLQIYQSFASQTSSSSSNPVNRRRKLWIPPKPFEVEGSRRSPTYPKSPFSHRRIFDISSLTENRIMNPAKQQRNKLDALKRNIKIEEFQKNWKLSITSPRGSIISADSLTEVDQSSVLNEVISKLAEKKPQESASVDKKSRRQRQREKMKAAKKNTSPAPKKAAKPPSSNLLPIPLDQSSKSHSFPHLLHQDEKPASPTRSLKKSIKLAPSSIPSTVQLVESQDIIKKDNSQENENIPDELDFQNEHQTIPSIPTIREAFVEPAFSRNFEEQNLSPRYGTAFGRKMLTSSYSNILSANTMRRMRDNPETMVGSLHAHEKLMSRSESNLSDIYRRQEVDERISKAYLRNKRLSFPRRESVPVITDSGDNYEPEEELIDLLKKFCIIREDRLYAYKRVFQKYVLMKSIRDREEALKDKTNPKYYKKGNDELESNSLEGQLRKNEKLLQNLRENIKEVQHEIAIAKDEVNKATARIAYRRIGTAMSALQDAESEKLSEAPKPVSIETKKAFLKELTADERRLCESDVEVRDRKVVLAHLRAKVKSLKRREKGLLETTKRLVKLIQAENLEKSFQKREKTEFTRKQSRIFQELHPAEKDLMDPRDFNCALRDLDKRLTFFDHSSLSEEIAKSKGVPFKVFCVAAALLETKNLYRAEPSNLNDKMNVCREYYSTLLGPDLEVLQIELEAAGIAKKQREEVVKKLARGDDDEKKLNFIDFVAYSPLFLNAHSKIVTNPLAT